MLKVITQKEVFERDDIHIFNYALNTNGIKSLEFGALFIIAIGVAIYPATHFDPPAWMVVPILFSVLGILALSLSQYWRSFVKKAILAYDDEFLFIGDSPEKVKCIPWKKIDIHNSGLAEKGKGGSVVMNIEGEKIPLRLYTMVVCVPQFETVLCTILTHIKENGEKKH